MVVEVGAGMVNDLLAGYSRIGMYNGSCSFSVHVQLGGGRQRLNPRISTNFRIGDHESSREVLNAA